MAVISGLRRIRLVICCRFRLNGKWCGSSAVCQYNTDICSPAESVPTWSAFREIIVPPSSAVWYFASGVLPSGITRIKSLNAALERNIGLGLRHEVILQPYSYSIRWTNDRVVGIFKIRIPARNLTAAGVRNGFSPDSGKSVLSIAAAALFHDPDLLCPAGFFVYSAQWIFPPCLKIKQTLIYLYYTVFALLCQAAAAKIIVFYRF